MQMAHYKNYIESRADWDFVGMYSDEGISGTNTKKRDGFNQMIEDALAECNIAGSIEVVGFEGLLVELCHQIGAGAVVKGLRAMTDFEYELQQADLNNFMAPDIESVYVMGSRDYGYISSSIVRELAALGRDVSFLVPTCIERRLARRFGRV